MNREQRIIAYIDDFYNNKKGVKLRYDEIYTDMGISAGDFSRVMRRHSVVTALNEKGYEIVKSRPCYIVKNNKKENSMETDKLEKLFEHLFDRISAIENRLPKPPPPPPKPEPKPLSPREIAEQEYEAMIKPWREKYKALLEEKFIEAEKEYLRRQGNVLMKVQRWKELELRALVEAENPWPSSWPAPSLEADRKRKSDALLEQLREEARQEEKKNGIPEGYYVDVFGLIRSKKGGTLLDISDPRHPNNRRYITSKGN